MGKNLKPPVSLRMSDDELALLKRLAQRYGGKSAAILAGLRSLDRQGEPTNDELIAILRRRMASGEQP